MNLIKNNIRRYILFVVLSLGSAAGNMCLIYIVNSVVKVYFRNQAIPSHGYFYLFAGGLLLFFLCRWTVSKSIIGFTQNALRQIRLDILQNVLRSAYYPLVKNKERIYSALTRDAGNIVNASISVVDVITNALIIIICLTYMGVLSWKLLLCIVGLMIFTVLIYAISEKKQRILFTKAMAQDDRFVKYLGEILDGFKEIVIERRKGLEIQRIHIIDAINTGVGLNKKAFVAHLNNRVIGQLAFYVFIGVLLLYLGRALGISNEVLVNFIFLVLYVFGPIETVVVLIPGVSQARASLKRLGALKADLLEGENEIPEKHSSAKFKTLKIKDMFYQYTSERTDEKSFSVGPLDFELEAGKRIFICGGNGGGKTTFINLLAGLFACDTGEIYVNDVRIPSSRLYAYRSMFAPVFSDFHLFDECYSVENIEEAKVKEYLNMFELESKVSFDGKRFNTIDLSTGQRKRLALVCAMLEGKPILILDEFGADQDPHFRKRFYNEILDYLKQEGFTVVAITHDDHYYGYCDYLYKMDYGKMELIETFDTTKVMA